MRTHIAFIKAPHLRRIMAGTKRFEFRCSFRRLACEGVEEGDTVLLKQTCGDVEAAATVGKVEFHRGLRPEQVARLAREYAAEGCASYVARYAPPANQSRPVNLALIQLTDVRSATLPPERTPRNLRSGWVTLD